MPSTFPCPACGQTIGADVAPGTLVRCPLCQQSVTVPGGAGFGGAASSSFPGQPPFLNPPPPLPTSSSAALAVWALVLGLVSLFPCLFFLGLPALICAIVAIIRTAKSPTRYRGRGMAFVGLVTGLIAVVGYPVAFGLAFPELAKQACRINMMQMDMALKAYEKKNKTLPAKLDDLVSGGFGPPNILICMYGMMHRIQPSYHYVPGEVVAGDPHRIIVYEDPRNHEEEGGNVLRADGVVEFLSASELAAAIDQLESAASEAVEHEDAANHKGDTGSSGAADSDDTGDRPYPSDAGDSDSEDSDEDSDSN